jgi:hypothetical protein
VVLANSRFATWIARVGPPRVEPARTDGGTPGEETGLKLPVKTPGFGMRRPGRNQSSVNPLSRRKRSQRRHLALTLCAMACIAAGMLAATGNAMAAISWPTPISWPPQNNLPALPTAWWSYLLPGGTGGSGSTPTPTPTPVTSGTPSSLPGKTFSGTFTGSAGSLDYIGYVPSTYKAGTAVPLVVSLHGCTESADQFRQLTRWDSLAEAKNFIVVFPQQSGSNNQFKCWNFFQTADMQRDAGEPSLIAGITRWVQQNYSIDAHRT